MTELNEQAIQLVEELETINKRAFRMAVLVHRDSSLRLQLAAEANLLHKRLLEIAKETERIGPDAKKRWFHTISEAMLDLDFAVAEREFTSLRLGDIVRWGK